MVVIAIVIARVIKISRISIEIMMIYHILDNNDNGDDDLDGNLMTIMMVIPMVMIAMRIVHNI